MPGLHGLARATAPRPALGRRLYCIIPMTKYARFQKDGRRVFGVVEGETVQELGGGLFGAPEFRGQALPLATVRLLAPCEPPKILAVGQNYISHLGERKRPDRPEMFYKPTSSLQDPDGPIELPADSEDAHYEGELVVVMGRTV